MIGGRVLEVSERPRSEISSVRITCRVSRAQKARRSGVVGINFDRLRIFDVYQMYGTQRPHRNAAAALCLVCPLQAALLDYTTG